MWDVLIELMIFFPFAPDLGPGNLWELDFTVRALRWHVAVK